MPRIRRICIAVTVSALALAGCTTGPPPTPRGADDPSSSTTTVESPEPTPSDVALSTHLDDAQAGPADRFVPSFSRPDPRGGRVTRYTRTFHGLPVFGGDIAVRTDGSGGYRGISNGLTRRIDLDPIPRVSVRDAQAKARTRFTGDVTGVQSPRLVVDASTGTGRLAWETVVVGFRPDGNTPSRLHVLTDARTGDVLLAWDAVQTEVGTGTGHYDGPVQFNTRRTGAAFALIDDARGGDSVCNGEHRPKEMLTNRCTPMTDGDNVWGSGAAEDPLSAAADVAYATAKTYDFYEKIFGRRGIFDNGRGVPAYVHVGNQMGNAFWLGEGTNIMVYGDGQHERMPFTELDIGAHEMTHGVTENSVPGGLVYAGESGGLNEATSDIMGTMVEFWAANPNDPGDYDIGEKLDLFGNGTPARRMYNQASDGFSLSCYAPQAPEFDPHQWSGVGNHFFFDLAEGTGKTQYGTSPVCGSAPGVTGIGREKAEQIWYRALTAYFVSTTNYQQARGYTLAAAADLYGKCGTEYRAVQRAWTAVDVTGLDRC